MKPLTPTSTAAIVAFASATVASVSADTFPVPKPTFRFQPFDKIGPTSQNIAQEKLGYIELTWNSYGLAPIEKDPWVELTTDQLEGASLLGFNEATWDCFINHYEDYTWYALEELGVQEHFVELGWTEAHWEGEADTIVYTDARWWGQLTDNEKVAANGICYFKDNWDKVDMNPNPSFFPHPMPNFRYKPWSELDAVTQNVAGGMMNYTESSWNKLGTSILEKNTFLNLDSDARAGAMDLGFYTHTWDCFMNHYLSFYWSSFHDDLKVAVETLGWDETMWSEKTNMVPSTEDTIWIDLTPDEKAAATRLCYFKETWDEEPVPRWYDYDTGMTTAITTNGPLPKDINLDIFQETGYVGKAPGSVGPSVYTNVYTTDKTDMKSSSHRAFVSLNVLVLVLMTGSCFLV